MIIRWNEIFIYPILVNTFPSLIDKNGCGPEGFDDFPTSFPIGRHHPRKG